MDLPPIDLDQNVANLNERLHCWTAVPHATDEETPGLGILLPHTCKLNRPNWRANTHEYVSAVGQYVCACMRVCMYACMRVCMYACMHTCKYSARIRATRH